MKVWSEEEGEAFRNSDDCFGREYNPGSGTIDVARITIRARFPASGWAYNEDAHEMGVIVRGQGAIETKDGKHHDLSVGDVVYLAPMERFFWTGDMDIIMPCGPAFDRTKHHIEEGV